MRYELDRRFDSKFKNFVKTDLMFVYQTEVSKCLSERQNLVNLITRRNWTDI